MKRYFVCVIFLCTFAAVSHAEERWALLVGIDQYASDNITPLKGAVNDARAMRDMLIKYARFPSENVLSLTSDDKDNLPKLGNIIIKLEYIASEAKPGDLFVFFFAGHGITMELDGRKKNYLLAYESDILSDFLLSKTGFSVEELNGYLGRIQSGNILLILDMCRNSPQAGRGDEDNLLTEDFVRSIGISPGEDNAQGTQFFATLYAASPGERAYEWPGKGRGFFSITLEEALSGKADKDDNGKVTLNEVKSYMSKRVPDLIKRELGSGRVQTPWVDMSGPGDAGDMVFSWATEQADPVSPSPDETVVSSRDLGSELTQQLSQSDRAKRKAEESFAELEAEADESQPSESLSPQQRAEGWIEVTGECRGADITPAEAQRKALEQARRNAIIQALGVESRTQEFLLRWETSQDFQQSFPPLSQSALYEGIFEEEAEPVWTPESIQDNPGEPPVPLYRVTLRTKIAREKSIPDPDFGVSLKLNNGTFRKGEEITLSITPTQDCYIAVFNVLSNRTVLIMYPAQGRTSKVVPGGESFSLPSEAERQRGGYFPVVLPSDKAEGIGSVLVIATKYNVPFFPEEVKQFHLDIVVPDGKVVLPTYQTALEEINRWLTGIPLDKRTFDVQQYKIENSDQ